MALFRKSKPSGAHSPPRQPSRPVVPTSPDEAVARVRANRDAIVMHVAMEVGKTTQGLDVLAVTGRLQKPSQAELQQVAIDYPAWALGQLIAQVGGLVGTQGEAASEAARNAALDFAAENLKHVIEGGSLDYLTDFTKLHANVERLADAAIEGFATKFG